MCESFCDGIIDHDSSRELWVTKLVQWIPELSGLCAFWNAAPNSASATDAITQDIILIVQKVGPLVLSWYPR
jgi:hypothetical protein